MTLKNSPDLDKAHRYAPARLGVLHDRLLDIEVSCFVCDGQHPGRIETDNNGPIVNCPLCNPGKGG